MLAGEVNAGRMTEEASLDPETKASASASPRAPEGDRTFRLVLVALTALAVAPFWLTRILPLQDYPQILVFARAWGDCRDPASPFFGTYTIGFPLAPNLLPILVLRALGAVVDLETAGRIVWTLSVIALPLASLDLLTVLRRDRWAVLLVYPLLLSYWVLGGFFAFATSAPLLVLGLSLGIRWLEDPTWRRGAAFSATLVALHLWHAIAFAQLVLDFGLLWMMWRAGDLRARFRALVPLIPGVLLFAFWVWTTFVGHTSGAKPIRWPTFAENASTFFGFVGPTLPRAQAIAKALVIVVLAASLAKPRGERDLRFRVANPFALLVVVAVGCYFALPGDGFGVEGLNNRQPWLAALLLVFAWRVPARRTIRAAVLAVVGGAVALVLAKLATLFVAFDGESVGASRLIDRLGPGETLLSPLRGGSSAFLPGRPLVALELYASIRHGGLPSTSFAGYPSNIVRYVGNKNPMPGLIVGWRESPILPRYDYVLLRSPRPEPAQSRKVMEEVAREGEWVLYGVCGSKTRPRCE